MKKSGIDLSAIEKDIDLWGLFETDFELRVYHDLTEPTCPSACIYAADFDLLLARCDEDTIEAAIAAVVEHFARRVTEAPDEIRAAIQRARENG